uniref:Retrovirus-related Pol polyprotein from transposon TNT 1-94 n=1 Tax=Tanacetum cinerariifolium TaxID=118510 RepID=A0A6L2JDG3_TANCI|nr:retrovirus-related Pol polyprotein from transposon TNT 1-94 [Tanacetum cinerariifolium]
MMANLSEDIQCAGSDTRPPMLDRYDFESWQQGIRLYCLGKDNGENVLKSIDEGPFKMEKFKETLADGALHLGPERNRVLLTLHQKKKRGLKLTFVQRIFYFKLYAYLKQHEAHANENKMMLERYTQHAIEPLALVSNVSLSQYPTQSSAILQYAFVPPVTYPPPFTDNIHIDSGLTPTDDLIENLTKINRVGNANPGQAKPIKCYNFNGIGHIARQCTYPKRPQNSEYFKDKMLLMKAQENGVVLDEERLLFSAGGQTNMFDDDVDKAPYVKENAVQVVQSNVSSVPNDALMVIINDIHEQAAQCVSENEQNKVVNESLTAKLTRYKEQVELYEKGKEQIERFRAENEKVKQHYKELYDSIKITRAKTIEKTMFLLTKNEKLKAQLKGKMQCVTMPAVKPQVLALGMYAIDVEPIPLVIGTIGKFI